MASEYGEQRKLACVVCGMRYDRFRILATFAASKRHKIITDDHGHRNGVLGHMHEEKWRHWLEHVDACIAAFEAAGETDEARAAAARARAEYEARELEILKRRRAEASHRHANKLKTLGVKTLGVGRNATKDMSKKWLERGAAEQASREKFHRGKEPPDVHYRCAFAGGCNAVCGQSNRIDAGWCVIHDGDKANAYCPGRHALIGHWAFMFAHWDGESAAEYDERMTESGFPCDVVEQHAYVMRLVDERYPVGLRLDGLPPAVVAAKSLHAVAPAATPIGVHTRSAQLVRAAAITPPTGRYECANCGSHPHPRALTSADWPLVMHRARVHGIVRGVEGYTNDDVVVVGLMPPASLGAGECGRPYYTDCARRFAVIDAGATLVEIDPALVVSYVDERELIAQSNERANRAQRANVKPATPRARKAAR